MTRQYFPIVLMCGVVSLFLTMYAPRNGKDPDSLEEMKLLDSLNRNSQDFGVTIDVLYYSQRILTIRGELNNYKGAIRSDSSKLFVNGKEMEYSVSVGNYYERYPHYSYDFEDRKIPKD